MRGFRFLLKFSYRNLWRAPKRTLIMIFSLCFGTGFIIWDLNFANSGSKEIMKEFLAQYAGQYQITHPEYYDGKNFKKFNIYKTISDYDFADQKIVRHLHSPRDSTCFCFRLEENPSSPSYWT
jgi:hypothetical protein